MTGELTAEDFREYFQALYGHTPFPWQERLVRRVLAMGWPTAMDLPTASGKTACIDVAVFAIALTGKGPRRIFFVVDRRVVVDAAFERMEKIAKALREATQGVLKVVADRLRAMSGGEPLVAYQMRGGIYRDDSWVRSPLQPMAIASTVDQVGSRLLFRGYGVWDNSLPIHAGIVANDSLILLDEAHCSRPFAETLDAVRRYRGGEWAPRDLAMPFAFVEMTATPVREAESIFRLEADDYTHAELRKRLFASKPTTLVVSKVRAKDWGKLADDLVKEAVTLSDKPGLRRIGVMVNRVRTARLVHGILEKKGAKVHLLIGRMRPADRAALPADVASMLSGSARVPDAPPVFVVATQCLEVGADLDFDGLVTECASIDALLQRFGRLDRIGELAGTGAGSEGRIVITTPMTDAKYDDAVYGPALTKTWQWLAGLGSEVDFGISSESGDVTVRERLQLAGVADVEMRREAPRGPMLLPAHLDAFVQTSPRPALEPDPALFLHGREQGSPEVQVIWRGDLAPERPDEWADTVAFCPPVSAEAMTVTLRDFRAWLGGIRDADAVASDVESADADEKSPTADDDSPQRAVLRWRGKESQIARVPSEIRPGDTLVLPADSRGWDELGHIPAEAARNVDVAERTRLGLRRGWILRLHPRLIEGWPENEARARLLKLAADRNAEKKDLVQGVRDYATALGGGLPWFRKMVDLLPKEIRGLQVEVYPTSDERHAGWILSTGFVEADSGDDESSAGSRVLLADHLKDVEQQVTRVADTVIADPGVRSSLTSAARLHDCGKADIRFQALLHGGDPLAAQFAPKPLAKGDPARRSRRVREEQRRRSGLPDGFRHELISLLLAQSGVPEDELALHLIASHHGRCRPFAPVVNDDGPDLAFGNGSITSDDRAHRAAHRLDSGVADRFWKLTRVYGWWGLAYLESLMRLGDWKASAAKEPVEVTP